ncbi:hypothetical protein BD770DRAFT_411935 [Pilaira anomala]|nr:hypothetical protein BD770DRAFT_411935 [Pilaira anomala]
MGIKINSPLPMSLASECRKAARILNSFTDKGKGMDIFIPPHILANAKGLAIFTVLKAGFLFSGRAGSGLVVARLPDGSWSAPSAIMTGGMGFGGQVGAELTDFIMVLNTTSAVKTFMHHGSITLGGNISVAAGPVGRNAEASGTASLKSVAAVYSYSKTRGLFAGVSLEGSVIFERFDANKKMYGGKVKSRDLLNGSISPPASASELYRALELKTNGGGGAGATDRMSTGRYEYRNDVNTDRYDDRNDMNTDNVSFASHNGPVRSFSRAKVHSMAKAGGGSNYGDGGNTDHYVNRNQIEYYGNSGRFNSSSDFDLPNTTTTTTPGQITNSRNEEDTTELKARALFNFTGEQEGDLIFHKGDIISIIRKTNTQNDWWTGRLNHRQGIFPANFVEML